MSEQFDPSAMQTQIEQTIMRHAPQWWANVRANLPLIRHDLAELPRNMDKTVAVCLSSGPSLTDYALTPEYWEYSFEDDEVDIFASPTNYSALRAANIVPQFLVSVDGADTQGKILGLSALTPNDADYLIACPYTSPNLTRRATVPTYWFHNYIFGAGEKRRIDKFGFNRIHNFLMPELKSNLVQAGSVSNAIFLIVHFLLDNALRGYKRIHLVGYDFGYPVGSSTTRVPRYHERDAWSTPLTEDRAPIENPNSQWFPVTLPDGTEFMTTELMSTYRHSLGILQLWGVNKGIEIINDSKGLLDFPITTNEELAEYERIIHAARDAAQADSAPKEDTEQ